MQEIKPAFSLLELCIVLIVASIFLIFTNYFLEILRMSKINMLNSTITKIRMATKNFKDLYYGLPGDISYTVEPNIISQVGDGDRFVGNSSVVSKEVFNFFPHLASTKIIDGAMQNEKNNLLFNINDFSNYFYLFEKDNIYFYVLASDLNSCFNKINRIYTFSLQDNSFLNASMAYRFDCKFDDCKPMTGKIIAYNHKITDYNNNKCVALKSGKVEYDIKNKISNCVNSFMHVLDLNDVNVLEKKPSDDYINIFE